jgi:hypothetical protein
MNGRRSRDTQASLLSASGLENELGDARVAGGPRCARSGGSRTRWQLVVLVSALLGSGLLSEGEAHAQAGATTPAVGASIEEATAEQKQLAQSHYDRGVVSYEAGDFQTALGAFEASYGVVRSPNAHLMLARALVGLEQWVRAHDELMLVEAEATGQERYQQALDKSRELRADVARRLSFVRFVVTGEGGPFSVRLRGQAVDPSATLTTLPGAAVVEVYDASTLRAKRSIELGPGETRELALEVSPLAPPPPAPAPEPDEPSAGLGGTFYVGAAVTAVGLAGFGVATAFGLMSKSSHDDLEVLCPGGLCPAGAAAEVDTLKSDGESAQTIHIVGLAVGAAGVATGVTLMIVGATSGSAPEAELGGVRLRPSVGLGFVSIDGSF